MGCHAWFVLLQRSRRGRPCWLFWIWCLFFIFSIYLWRCLCGIHFRINSLYQNWKAEAQQWAYTSLQSIASQVNLPEAESACQNLSLACADIHEIKVFSWSFTIFQIFLEEKSRSELQCARWKSCAARSRSGLSTDWLLDIGSPLLWQGEGERIVKILQVSRGGAQLFRVGIQNFQKRIGWGMVQSLTRKLRPCAVQHCAENINQLF